MNREIAIRTERADEAARHVYAMNAAEPYNHGRYTEAAEGLKKAIAALFAAWPPRVAEALEADALEFWYETNEPISHYVNWHLPVARVTLDN